MLGRCRMLLAGALAVVLSACSTTTPLHGTGAGRVCNTDDECAVGSCLPFAIYPIDGGACSVAGTDCTTTCETDADCAKLGSNFKCFDGCPGGEKTCGAT